MKPETEITEVIFRTFHTGETIALFPYEPSDSYGHYCLSYQHIGQHGGATTDLCREGTRPSTPDEIAPLKEELERIGYKLRELKRTPSNAREVRRAKLKPE